MSFASVFDSIRLLLTRSVPPDPSRLVTAGEIAIAEAERLWALNIYDPPNSSAIHEASRAQIDRMIRSTDGLGWTWQKPYAKDGDYEWCGAFAASCWATAGLALKPHRYTFWSSTYRLDLWGRYKAYEGIVANPRPPKGQPERMLIELDAKSKPSDARFPDGTLPRAGDIVIVGDGSPRYGDHITLCAAYDAAAGAVSTIEGNAGSRRSGLAPDGTDRHGVIKATRIVGGAGFHVRRVIRPALADIG